MGFENAKSNLGDTNLKYLNQFSEICYKTILTLIRNMINIIKVYQQYYEHMGHKVITVGAGGSQCRHYN